MPTFTYLIQNIWYFKKKIEFSSTELPQRVFLAFCYLLKSIVDIYVKQKRKGGRKKWKFIEMCDRGVQPAADSPHTAQDGYECGPTQNCKFT